MWTSLKIKKITYSSVIHSHSYYFIFIFIIVTGNTFHIYNFQILLTNYKHTQPTLGLSVTFVFNIEYIYFFIKREHTYMYYKINRTCNINL